MRIERLLCRRRPSPLEITKGHTMQPDDRSEASSSGTDAQEYAEEDLESLIEHADRPFAIDSFGTTATEQEHGESLDQRLAQERPETSDGKMWFALSELDEPDEEAEMVAEGVLEREPFLSPEEAAISVRDRAPGSVDHDGDEYVELYDEYKNGE
jgi:hypothetical protein